MIMGGAIAGRPPAGQGAPGAPKPPVPGGPAVERKRWGNVESAQEKKKPPQLAQVPKGPSRQN